MVSACFDGAILVVHAENRTITAKMENNAFMQKSFGGLKISVRITKVLKPFKFV